MRGVLCCHWTMASRWSTRQSPPLRRPPLRTPPRNTPPCSPRGSLLKTPPMVRTPPLLSSATRSPLRTPPLFSNISPLPVSHTPPLFSDAAWRTEPIFHYDLRWVSPVAASPSPPRLNIKLPAGVNPAVVPTTMKEVDHFLSSAWDNAYDLTTSSEYSRKVIISLCALLEHFTD